MIRFFLDHFAAIVGGLCLSWGLFSLGRLWEREKHDADREAEIRHKQALFVAAQRVSPEKPVRTVEDWEKLPDRSFGYIPTRRSPYNWRDEEL